MKSPQMNLPIRTPLNKPLREPLDQWEGWRGGAAIPPWLAAPQAPAMFMSPTHTVLYPSLWILAPRAAQ